MIRVIALALVGPVALSLWGAIYFGYRQSPYLAVIIWAAICTGYLLWWSRDSFRHMFSQYEGSEPFWWKPSHIPFQL